MPITCPVPTEKLSQKEFGEITFEVVREAFDMHDRFGRFFDEWIDQNELVERFTDAITEVPVHATYRTFSKTDHLDLLRGTGALFEMKCVSKLTNQHRAQLLNYLLLTGLEHGKLINFRPTQVEHEFVNCHQPLAESRRPTYEIDSQAKNDSELERLHATLTGLIADWGIG